MILNLGAFLAAGVFDNVVQDSSGRSAMFAFCYCFCSMSTIFVPPVWLKLRNDYGGLSKSNFVVLIIYICVTLLSYLIILIASSVVFLLYLSAIPFVVGTSFGIVIMVMAMIQLIRQRNEFLQGYLVYQKVRNPRGREIEDDLPSAPPLYQDPYTPVLHGPVYQEDFAKDPSDLPVAQFVAPVNQAPRIGEFDYDKRN